MILFLLRFPSISVMWLYVISGGDLLRLTRDDLIQICGLADGIRLNNALQSRAVRPRLTVYVCQGLSSTSPTSSNSSQGMAGQARQSSLHNSTSLWKGPARLLSWHPRVEVFSAHMRMKNYQIASKHVFKSIPQFYSRRNIYHRNHIWLYFEENYAKCFSQRKFYIISRYYGPQLCLRCHFRS